MTKLSRWVLTFFAYPNEESVEALYHNIFYLVDWGFSYTELMNMPISRFRKYVDMLIESRKKENANVGEGSENSKMESPNVYDKVFRK